MSGIISFKRTAKVLRGPGPEPEPTHGIGLTVTRYATANKTADDVLAGICGAGLMDYETATVQGQSDNFPTAFEITITVKEL